jgi:hypothetical protein
MFVLKAETNLFVNRLAALNYEHITNMLKVLYRHVKEIMQLSSNLSVEFIQFLSTVKHVCKIMIKHETAIHTFKETHPESCLHYNVHGKMIMCSISCADNAVMSTSVVILPTAKCRPRVFQNTVGILDLSGCGLL